MKHLIFALMALAFLPHAAQAQIRDPEIIRAEKYLNGLKTAQADFLQSSSDGTRLSGQFYLKRPGKMRFNYNEIKDFIVADGVFVYYYDATMGSQSNAPIGQTMADFILRKNLSLSGDLTVTHLTKKDGQIIITLVQTDNPGAGKVQLFFNDIPYNLARWRVTDAQGVVTDISLKNMKTGMKLDQDGLFGFIDPKGRKPTND